MTVRVRVLPVAHGHPHVGLIRTALFNWAYARHTGGAFVFRIEDTDAARDSEESYDAMLDALQVARPRLGRGSRASGGRTRRTGSPHAVRPLSRRDRHGCSTRARCTRPTPRPRRSRPGISPPAATPSCGYDNYDRNLTDEQRAAFAAEGRKPVAAVADA